MYLVKPANISTVTRFKRYVVFALVTFWATFFSFFFLPVWSFLICAVVHVLFLILSLDLLCKTLVYLLLAVGEGGSCPAHQIDVPADAPK